LKDKQVIKEEFAKAPDYDTLRLLGVTATR